MHNTVLFSRDPLHGNRLDNHVPAAHKVDVLVKYSGGAKGEHGNVFYDSKSWLVNLHKDD